MEVSDCVGLAGGEATCSEQKASFLLADLLNLSALAKPNGLIATVCQCHILNYSSYS